MLMLKNAREALAYPAHCSLTGKSPHDYTQPIAMFINASVFIPLRPP